MEVIERQFWTTSGLVEADANVAVLAHEIVHLIGASRDDIRIMRPKIGHSLALSDKSATLISKFTQKNPLAWYLLWKFCYQGELLHNRELNVLDTATKRYKIMGFHVGIPDSRGGRKAHVLFGPGSKARFNVIPVKDCPESGKCHQRTSQPTNSIYRWIATRVNMSQYQF